MATTNLTVPIILNWKDIEAYMAQNDIVEVVRCKDCIFRADCEYDGSRFGGDDFCSRGERKENG